MCSAQCAVLLCYVYSVSQSMKSFGIPVQFGYGVSVGQHGHGSLLRRRCGRWATDSIPLGNVSSHIGCSL